MKIHLDIVSAEHSVFSGMVELVVATSEMGELGIVAGHSPLLAVLKPGEVRVTTSAGEENALYYVSGGLVEVQPFTVTILADVAIRADNLDEAAAILAKEKAKEAMSAQSVEMDYSVATAELARAVAQIKMIQKLRKNLG